MRPFDLENEQRGSVGGQPLRIVQSSPALKKGSPTRKLSYGKKVRTLGTRLGPSENQATPNKESAITVEPALSGTVLSGHPLLSGQLSKSRKLCPLIIVILTSIKGAVSRYF